jgi:hypothetical protein
MRGGHFTVPVGMAPGNPQPLGPSLVAVQEGSGGALFTCSINFAVFSRNASAMSLCLMRRSGAGEQVSTARGTLVQPGHCAACTRHLLHRPLHLCRLLPCKPSPLPPDAWHQAALPCLAHQSLLLACCSYHSSDSVLLCCALTSPPPRPLAT